MEAVQLMVELCRYPTNDATINDLCKFLYERLPAAICKPIHTDLPSLAEDWWVEEKVAAGYVIPGVNDNEQGLRLVYRWGRHVAITSGDWFAIDYHKELLLHQITELIPTLFFAVANIQQVMYKEI